MFLAHSYPTRLMSAFLLFLLLLPPPAQSQSQSQSPSSCPTRLPTPTPTPKLRIVNGNPAPFLAPFLVALGRDFDGPFTLLCTAVLISPLHILTAAHCSPNNYTRVSLVATSAATGVPATIDSVHFPPRSTVDSVDRLNDLALLTLTSPAPSNASFALLPPPGYEPPPNTFARVAGYGDIAYSQSNPDNVLNSVDIPITAPSVCASAYPNAPTTRICAGYPAGGCDSCQGDSGGPLFQYDSRGHPVVIALVASGYLCAYPDFPGVYMKVEGLKQWLRDEGAQFEEAEEMQQVRWWPQLESAGPGGVSLNVDAPMPSATAEVMAPSPSPHEQDITPRPSEVPPTPSRLPDQVSIEQDGVEGTSECDAGRIPGETQVDEEVRGAMVAFTEEESGGASVCSGVLVSERWVLTSRECKVQAGWIAWVGGRQVGEGVETRVEQVEVRDRDGWVAAVRISSGVESGRGMRVNTDDGVPGRGEVGRGVGYGAGGVGAVDLEVGRAGVCEGVGGAGNESLFCAGRVGDGRECEMCGGEVGGGLLQGASDGGMVVVGIAVVVSSECGVDDRAGLFARVGGMAEWLRGLGVRFSEGVVDVSVSGRASLQGRTFKWVWGPVIVVGLAVAGLFLGAVELVWELSRRLWPRARRRRRGGVGVGP